MSLLKIRQLQKSFTAPDGRQRQVVAVPAFDLEERQQVALSGASGSGKTTFLNLIAGILSPDAGSVRFAGQETTSLDEAARDRLRATCMGYVFQTFHLLPAYTCLENVLLGMAFGGRSDPHRAQVLLRRMGLENHANHLPRQLSTGQQQRVAVARALANRPKLVLADEPTGHLDPRLAAEALRLIRETCAEEGAALLLVTHDHGILNQFECTQDFQALNRS
jgi:putative ABC transport system ATP-binding protein